MADVLPPEDQGIQVHSDPLPGGHASKPVENDLPFGQPVHLEKRLSHIQKGKGVGGDDQVVLAHILVGKVLPFPGQNPDVGDPILSDVPLKPLHHR